MSASNQSRIHLSGPDVGEADREALLRAFDGGWIAPVGPELAAFEEELAAYVGVESCVALSSGTAGLHLALLDAGVKPEDEVVVQSATFAASAFAVAHAGASPIFCDVDADTWCLSPDMLSELLAKRAAQGRLPKAVMSVDLYGSCGDYPALEAICAEYDIPLIEDAAEGLGSRSGGQMAGSFGHAAILSFNGNKIITTSGGGALLGSRETTERARYLATQAKLPAMHYEHDEIGFNYRMSNLLAALGRAQLGALESKIARRTEIHETYRSSPGLEAMSWCAHATTERPNHWLTVGMLPLGFSPSKVCAALDSEGIEARPAWKPMHLQPVFAGAEMTGGSISEALFESGICLPSSSALTDEELGRVTETLSVILAGATLATA